ncbi:MAG: EAL domain-containing protein, partial [Nocardiopsis sp. BM-2018]
RVRSIHGDRLVLAFRPIDDEIRQASRLQATQERFEKLAGTVASGILSSQAGMRVDYVNQRCCDVFGAEAEMLLGLGWLELVHPQDALAAEDVIGNVIATATDAQVSLRILRPDDGVRWAEMNVSAVRSARDVGFVATIEDVTTWRQLTEELQVQARHDPLTGLPNRLALREQLGDMVATAGARLAVLFVDLDHFKDVNDSLGHSAGDRLLRVVAERLRLCVRADDMVARFGGDEFVIVLRNLEAGRVEVVANRILDAMRAPVEIEGDEAFVSASVGVVQFVTRPGHEHLGVDAILRDADIAMHRAKQAGRDQLATFDTGMRDQAQQRMSLNVSLRRALDEPDGQLDMVYQPLVELGDGRTVGFEALMRWDLRGHGAVSPTVFVPLAEETGLMAHLTRFALDRSLADLARWRSMRGGERLWISVNISARDLADPDLTRAVETALSTHGLPPAALRLELTESAMMIDPAMADRVLGELRDLGIGVSVDDFGTGYSSLAYLQRLPVDTIKIDRAFVASLGLDRSATALIAAIVAMSKALGLRVVAEGVESGTQVDQLVPLGTDLGQGYFFSRPLPAADIAASLADGVPAGGVDHSTSTI